MTTLYMHKAGMPIPLGVRVCQMVYQIENGVNKLLSICGSKDSLAKIISHLNELGYVDIKTKPFIQNKLYKDLFDNIKIEEDEK